LSYNPETITIRLKRKYVWLTLGVLMVLLAASPIIALYAPVSSSAPGASSSGPSGGGSSSGSSGPAPNCPNPCTVLIQNSVFGGNSVVLVGGQPTIIVAKGTIIYWKNADDTSHTSTSTSTPALWNTGTLTPGQTSKGITFNNDGIFPYMCLIHPMSGQVIVVG